MQEKCSHTRNPVLNGYINLLGHLCSVYPVTHRLGYIFIYFQAHHLLIRHRQATIWGPGLNVDIKVYL